MKTFKEYMSEETNPFALSNGFVGVNDEKVRDNINALLSGITMKPFLTPHIALERVSKVLANYHIYLPKQTFEDIDDDYVVYEVNQFGEKSGMTNDGEVVTKMSDPYYIYFEYKLNESGSYDVFCEIVDSDELEELTNEADDEEEDAEELDENYHPSYTSAIQTAVAHAKKRGYEVDPEDYDSKVASGPRKPSEGKTVSHNLKLTKGGKPTKKGLAIQVYNRGGDKTPYELNHYISEEENLQELSKKTLKSYISKASTRKAQNAADQGRIEVSSNRAGMDLYKQIGKDTKKREKGMALANKKLEEEEKSGMPAWYEKEKSKSASLRAMTKEKKKEQGKKIKYAIRNMKEEQLDEVSQEKQRDYHAKAASDLKVKRQKLDRGDLTMKDFKKGQNRVKGLKMSAKKMINEIGDTPAGKKAINDVAFRGDAEIAYQASRSRPQKKKLKKAMRAVDLAIDTHERRGRNVLGSYLKRAYGLGEMEDKSVTGKGTITYKDPKTGKIKDYISPVTLNNPHMQASPDRFKMPNPVPLPPERPKIPVPTPRPKNLEENDSKKQVAKTPEKANFNIAKKLARQASKEALKKAMEKKSKK
jgi:hypothetical protein